MKRSLVMFVILATLTLALASVAFAIIPQPSQAIRIGGCCLWTNGKVYWVGGRSNGFPMDAASKEYALQYGNGGISAYDPTNNTWAGSKWDGTGPLGFDTDGDGKCEWAITDDWERAGLWAQTNQGVAYDYDNDGVKEIYTVIGYMQDNGEIWRYDPNDGPRGSWAKEIENPDWGGFRRGAVAINGSKIYMGAGPSIDHPLTRFDWYDIATRTFGEGPAGPDSQQGPAVVVNNKFYIMGGTANNGTGIYECNLSGATPTWTNGAAPIANLQVGVVFSAAVAYNGKIYVIGGHKPDGTESNAIQKFDPVTKTVTVVGTMPKARFTLGATVDPATGILYFGGGSGGVGDDIYWTQVGYNNWWKTDLDDATLTFTQLPDDPSYFPYEDWDTGREISGTVTDQNGNPAPGSIVGIKKTTQATADAMKYLTTDTNGNFGPATIASADVYVAAWNPAFAPTADTFVAGSPNPATVNLQYTATAKKNISTNGTAITSVGTTTAANAVDGNSTTRWESGEAETATFTVDLGSTQTVSGVVIFWEWAQPSDYTVDITTGDPSGSPTWTPVYSVTGGIGGWYAGNDHFIDPIRLGTPVQARAVRINATKGSWGGYSIFEFQILGTSENDYAKIGDIKKLIPGTVVKLNKAVTISGANDSGFGPAGMTFWAEEFDRANGIKVVVPANEDGDGPATTMGYPGDAAEITGKVAKDATTGEVYIEATNVQTWQQLGKGLRPVGINNKALVTSDMPVGLYVKTWGAVKSVNTTDSSFVISDGSTKDGAPVEITVVRGANMKAVLPEVGQWLAVKGALCGGGKIYEWPVDGFIRGWLINGAYTVANPSNGGTVWQGENLANDFLGGETTIAPKLGDTAPNGGTWFTATVDDMVQIFDLNSLALIKVNGQGCTYASVWVKPGRDFTDTDNVSVKVGSADGYILYVDNSYYNDSPLGPFKVVQDTVNREVTPDEDAWAFDTNYQPLILKAGEWNHILLKVNNIDGSYGFSLRFTIDDPSNPGSALPIPLEVSIEKPAS